MPFSNKPITYPNAQNLRIRSRRGMPHFELDGGIYFITFRLADSLPAELIDRLRSERSALLKTRLSPLDYAAVANAFGVRFDQYLDENRGRCELRDPRLAQIVETALMYHDTSLYDLIAWSVMPNHVHVLVRLFNGRDLDKVLHSWKSFTANEINRLLRRVGRFWQREYFDRIVRDQRELENVTRYILDNPAKSGLTEWPFVGCQGLLD